MVRNYFKIAWRNLICNKTFSFLNILGLTLGMTVFLLIILYVRYESGFDKFHSKGENVYRVAFERYNNGELMFESATVFPKVGKELPHEIPGIEMTTRLFLIYGGAVVRYEDKTFHENSIYLADSTFTDMFDFPWVAGDRATALDEVNSVILSSDLADRMFPGEDPIGKHIRVGNPFELQVTGVMESVENSHLPFDLLISYSTGLNVYGENFDDAWGWYDFYNYLRLAPGVNPATIEARFPAFINKFGGENESEKVKFSLQPLPDIYLTSNLIQEARVNGSQQTVQFLFLIAIAILFIAWINYINLATAKAINRAREVGIRKSVGAERGQLMIQFLLESFLINSLAAALAILATDLLIPTFRQLSGAGLSLELLSDGQFWGIMLMVLLAGSFVSGLYPAFVLSGYRPIQVLKGQFKSSTHGLFLRKGLVTLQFVASILLIAGTLVVYHQLSFMQNQSLGIDIDQKLVVRGPQVRNDSLYNSLFSSFRNEVSDIPGVNNLTASTEIPGNLVYWTNRIGLLEDEEIYTQLYMIGVDENYTHVLSNQLLEGRNFSQEFEESSSIILNEEAIRVLGFTSPREAVGRDVLLGRGDTMRVVGVMANYHQQGLKNDITPAAFLYRQNSSDYFVFSIDKNVQQVVAELSPKFTSFFPGNPFEYFLLDDHFSQQYANEKRFGNVFGIFSFIAIVIASLGLIGLSLFTAAQRTKEIGIRKVLGASKMNILQELSREFLVLVLLANLFAWPLTWWIMDQWLENFAYHIELGMEKLLLAALITLVIAFLAIYFQAWRAASNNPVNALRTE